MAALTLYLSDWDRFHMAPGAHVNELLCYADPYPVQVTDLLQRAALWLHQSVPIPIAPLTASQDLERFVPQAFWVRLDPVHLEPDRDTLVLFPGKDIGIGDDEARALVAAFNEHFAQEGVQLEYGASTRWYVRLPQPVDIQTVPLHEAAYANLHYVQPQGGALRYWNRLINEAQMLFFQHPVNEARREQGLPEINGLWLWGEGRLPEAFNLRPELKVLSDDVFVKGLGVHINATVDSQNYELPHLETNQQAFLHLTPPDTPEEMVAAWQALETQLWGAVLQALKTGRLQEVLMDFGGAQAWHLPRKNLKRFWRRWRKVPPVMPSE